ncbi:spore germination protein [Solibacillus kalamii]|uniref:Spore gernimation protein GerC n=1 Tax=Solibacillus kalamii TaxID=1748298 RepID=A0ABX3ZJV6_9BACL|nr:Ger(x)C family spore germination protein [Solibacillus kalamii]MBM7664597.1 spore germination protein [Solibacillus kalamii]OUZ39655.1 spore gernimation protein GerC [Solibacillus kalamii]
MNELTTFKKLILLFACIIFLVGCAEQKILERISLTTLVGFDLADDDKLAATAVIRQINPDLESKIELQSATALTSRGARSKIDLKTSKTIGSGQLRVVLYGEELAKVGLNENIHILKMNSEISNATYMASVEGDLNELLEYKYENISDLGQHIYQLIKYNVDKQYIISSTLHEINRDKLSFIGSYSMPILEREENNIKISGIAFFNEGKIVGKLPAEESIYILMVKEKTHSGTLELEIPITTLEKSPSDSSEGLPIAIDSINSKRKIKLVDPAVPEFNLTIKIDCRLLEVDSDVSMDNPSIIHKLEKEINKKIESEINRIIDYSHEIDTDIFQFGEYYKAQNRNADIDKNKWDEMFSEMKVNVTVNTTIIRDGVFQ